MTYYKKPGHYKMGCSGKLFRVVRFTKFGILVRIREKKENKFWGVMIFKKGKEDFIGGILGW
jgi:hypothetical protein